MDMSIALLLWLQSVWAQDVYMSVAADGTISFTDSPSQDQEFVVFDVNGPPPTRKQVTNKNFPKIDQFDGLIVAASQQYLLSAALIKAVVMAESGMNPNAKSHAGAQGLMQLMPATARGLGVTDPWDPEQNINGGSKYLRKNIDRFGDIRLALAAYNAGPGNVIKYKGIPPFEETQVYVERVMDLYEMFLIERPINL
jgi:soluble lytic murein transglycosylase-like protein